MNETDISNTIAIEYQRDLNKPELINFKMLVKQSRKFGFPIICTLKGKSHQEQLSAAAALLVEVAGAWPGEGVPADLKVEEGTPLHNDAKWLLEHTRVSCFNSFKHIFWPVMLMYFVIAAVGGSWVGLAMSGLIAAHLVQEQIESPRNSGQ